MPTSPEDVSAQYIAEREALERRRQVRGLLLLLAIVLLLSVARAGVGRVFPVRWWHPW